MSRSDEIELHRRLREADEEELARWIGERGDEIEFPAARGAFRNPFLSGSLIERLLELRHLASTYEASREAAFHPRCPRTVALACVGRLYLTDLVRLGIDTRLHPIVRRAADLRVLERLAGLAVGERIAIARVASAAVIAALRQDSTPRVIAALLENPRLTEPLLLPLLASDRAAPRALEVVARSARWGARRAVRLALCRNPATPLAETRRLLPALSQSELGAVAHDPRLSQEVSQLAARLAARAGRGVARAD